MKRNIYVLFLIAILISVCVMEEILLKSTHTALQGYSNELTTLFAQHKENLNFDVVINKFDETKSFWDSQKKYIKK